MFAMHRSVPVSALKAVEVFKLARAVAQVELPASMEPVAVQLLHMSCLGANAAMMLPPKDTPQDTSNPTSIPTSDVPSTGGDVAPGRGGATCAATTGLVGGGGEGDQDRAVAGGYVVQLRYSNFDIILDRFSRVSQLHPTPHAPCDILYLVPMLVVC